MGGISPFKQFKSLKLSDNLNTNWNTLNLGVDGNGFTLNNLDFTLVNES